MKKYRQKNKDTLKIYQRDYDLKLHYNISLENYNELFDKQQGYCLLCKVHQTNLKRTLVVDHCHSTNKIRGLLCHNCNAMLGQAKDNPETLKRGSDYLKGVLKC